MILTSKELLQTPETSFFSGLFEGFTRCVQDLPKELLLGADNSQGLRIQGCKECVCGEFIALRREQCLTDSFHHKSIVLIFEFWWFGFLTLDLRIRSLL